MSKVLIPKSAGISDAVAGFAQQFGSTESRISAITSVLQSPAGPKLRAEAGRWVVEELIPVEKLVPPKYEPWRAPVRDAMLFVVEHLSADRLAPKLVEQFELPPQTSYADRLLRLISKVPALQKLGQIIARNRHLRAALRKALTQLEDGIRDVRADEVGKTVRHELGKKFDIYGVRVEPRILKEASVSAVVRFTWMNPATEQRESGVLKVLKNYIPVCFAEDIRILQDLADFFGKHRDYGFSPHVIPDTFTKVRRHLQHEVDFVGEQRSLIEAAAAYSKLKGVRIPKLIPELCTSRITAMSEEHGQKVTRITRDLDLPQRRKIAARLVELLIGQPLLSGAQSSIFHADPHAGNILFNRRTGGVVLLDWALAERLSSKQRRELARLFVGVALRNPALSCDAIEHLAEKKVPSTGKQRELLQRSVDDYLQSLPAARLPRFVDATALLEEVALAGFRFPSSLIMFSKALFTLDGVLDEVRGGVATAESTIAAQTLKRWFSSPRSIGKPLTAKDWLTIPLSTALYFARLGVEFERVLARRLLGDAKIA